MSVWPSRPLHRSAAARHGGRAGDEGLGEMVRLWPTSPLWGLKKYGFYGVSFCPQWKPVEFIPRSDTWPSISFETSSE